MFRRYAVYYTPEGSLAEVGAAWLGWDLAKGARVPHPDIPGLDAAALTAKPRRYGLHGTIKPPFFLQKGTTEEELHDQLTQLCGQLPPVTLDGLELAKMPGFVAVKPIGSSITLAKMASQVVTQLDGFRAPPTEEELARRRRRRFLSAAQEQHLANWGYPYVMDQFRFHITLTGRVGDTEEILAGLKPYFAPHLPARFGISSLTLVGQDAAGMFHEIRRYSLTG